MPMALLKRKHSPEESNTESSASSSQIVHSDDEVDITAALTGKKAKSSNNVLESDGEDDYEELEALIKDSVAKRDKKEGTKILRQTKGKAKTSKGEVGGGSFQSMGLHPPLLRSLTLRGYKVPTPIQRLSIPTLLANPPRDLVGMARTGSGKTLAYMVPLTQRLSGRHATTFGARALILIPTRELALQVLKVGKELVRGWNSTEAGHAGDNTNDDDGDDGGSAKGQALRWGLVVGGESMDEQFEMITSNPDVIIATPGRLLHLIVEMNLDLRSVQYVVFDEADRLFEMGFSTALDEILHRLPSTRQTLLFSATLPKSLVEFAKAGLQDPKLVRLDAESKISSDLRMAFFSVKQAEKDACLLVLLRDIILVPLGSPAEHDGVEKGKINQKGKGKDSNSRHAAPHQTLIFVATKHHVEYVNALLTTAGYSVSHIYGQLDQAARTLQMERFRRRETSVLVVTDVAARGIDIPVLSHVVNFDFPAGARVFVHRVGRTARAGRTGWAWSFITATELPHLLDLQLFLGRPLRSTVDTSIGERAYIESLILGAVPRTKIDDETEYVRTLDSGNTSLTSLREVMRRGHGMYERSQAKASQASYKRAKEMMRSGAWGFATTVGEANIHPVFRLMQGTGNIQGQEQEEEARRALLNAVNSFSPAETVFEIGNRGKSASAALMKDRRKALEKARERAVHTTSIVEDEVREAQESAMPAEDIEMADEDDIEAAFASGSKHGKHRDEEFYLPYVQKDAMTEKGYSLKDGASFAEQASGATFDLTNDEAGTLGTHARHVRSQLKWDRKKKRFIRGSGEGADNVKIVKTEGGTRLPVTYRSGRFEEWSKKTHVRVPRVGEKESDGAGTKVRGGGKRFKHQSVTAAKPLHKLNKDYERKARQMTKKEQERGGGGEEAENSRPSITKTKKAGMGKKGKSRYGGKPIGRVKSELKSAEQIRKARQVAERKKAKNSRPSRKKGKR